MSSIGSITSPPPTRPPLKASAPSAALARDQVTAKRADDAAKQAVGQIANDQKASAGAGAIKADEQGVNTADAAAAKAAAAVQTDKSANHALNVTI